VPLLEVESLDARYDGGQVLHGVSLGIEQGEIAALLGANGAGKTTTLRAISGLVRKSGEVVFEGRRVTTFSPERIARLGIAHVPEGRGVMAELTVRENLRLGAHLRPRSAVKADLAEVYRIFPRLEERQRQAAGTLSGGEQQMLALARALMSRPRLLMLDEPSLGLAPLVVREIYSILVRLNREQGLTVLVIEQNAAIALGAASSGFVLEVGHLVLSGPSSELSRNESIRRAYLGDR
jgi:branched-chain amino acid transport system ATP-binding protein